jgi:predicted metal-dependent hydrolase
MTRPSRPQLALLGTFKIILEGQSVSYTLKRSSRAKYVRLEVRTETGLTVVVPRSYKLGNLSGLLKKKREWILSKLGRHGKAQPLVDEKELKSGDSIPYLGRHLKLVTRNDPGMADNIKLERNRLVLRVNSRNGHLNLLLESWYREQAERLLRERADAKCPQLGVSYARLTIRGARTRWGSCSLKHNLNFNWKLMMVPEPVIDYVIIHELTHLKEMNHSKKFWNLVAQHCPQWRECRKWLRNHEVQLTSRLSG